MLNDILMDHLRNPRNLRTLTDPDGRGTAVDPSCGDTLTVELRVDSVSETIADIAFQCQGCQAAVATASVLTGLVGRHLDEAVAITAVRIGTAAGGVPQEFEHGLTLCANALQNAIVDYVRRAVSRLTGEPPTPPNQDP